VLCIVSGFTISYVRARAEALGAKPTESFMRRAERLMVLLFSLFLGLFELPALDAFVGVPHSATFLTLTALLALNLVGCVSIFNAARQALNSEARNGEPNTPDPAVDLASDGKTDRAYVESTAT
jgi:CDP-diacylglycerol--glycerol-3-phosphate 3-phosphatidyltransferase